MAIDLTLKNIPDEVYQQLKTSAGMHRRSVSDEAIVCLEAVLMSGRVSPKEWLTRARALRAALPGVKLSARDIDAFKRQGRR